MKRNFCKSYFAPQYLAVLYKVLLPRKNTVYVQEETGRRENILFGYLYNDWNYVDIRELGTILGYKVSWDEAAREILIAEGGEGQNVLGDKPTLRSERASLVTRDISVDGKDYQGVSCLSVDGRSYFRLRDMESFLDFSGYWDNMEKTIPLTTPRQKKATNPVVEEQATDLFTVSGAKYETVEGSGVTYKSNSKEYDGIVQCLRGNIDETFEAESYFFTEEARWMGESVITTLRGRLMVHGYPSNNFGYDILCIDDVVKKIRLVGNKNPEFDITKIALPALTEEEAKKKAVETDGFSYKVDEQIVYRYFDMNTLQIKTDVETVYMDHGGAYFATTHTF